VKKLKMEHSLALFPFALAIWSISRVWNVLPSIMQDEYIYTSQAKNLPFSEQTYSNYLFSWIMGLTNNCGTEFYSCTKGINSVFFLVTVFFTFLIASRFLSFRWSVFVASVTALTPIAIPVSYFMPEAMYFAMMTLTIWLTLVVSKGSNWLLWSVSGLALGATALVKPHALFMLPAFAIFAFIYSYKKHSSGWTQATNAAVMMVTGFVVSKFGMGFLFAGSAGLKLFGGYESPVQAISGAIATPYQESPEPGLGTSPDAAPVNSDSIVESAPASSIEAASGLDIFLQVSLSHLAAHTAVLALLAGIPLILSLRIGWSIAKTKQPVGDASALFLLVGLITASMIGVVALFEAYVTASGDDHSNRLILRYYEFLLPQFLVMGLLLSRFTNSALMLRVVQGVFLIVASMSFTIFYPVTIDRQYADSSTLPGIGDSQGLFIFVGLLVSSAVAFWIVNPERGNQVMGRFVTPLVLIFALVLSQNKLIEINGTPAYFDRAGWDSRTYLQDVSGDRILVIGRTRTEVFTVKFWIDQANIRDLLVPEGTSLTPQSVAGVDYVVTLGNITVDFPHELVTQGDGYTLVRVVN
jgi:phosphoglycerol transferase